MTSEIFTDVPTSIDAALRDADAVRSLVLAEAGNPHFPVSLPGQWSLEDNLYHLHLVERGSASAIRQMIEGDKQERFSDEAVKAIWERMNRVVPNRTTKLIAPDGVSPKDTPSKADCIRLLGESRERLLTHCAKTTTEDLLRTGFPHPVLGVLPGLLWITFIAMHEARHLDQILELKNAAKP
ncbi:MAG: DinB family protein [Candidatus Kapabacteria bacterium]|nr:DinB family protein [Candidatus Kapabacteria bacterium]